MLKWITLFLAISTSAWSQELILGTVIDDDTNDPVPFASVAIEGTSKGTSTNLYGQFSLSIDEPATLLISCIGYETLKIPSSEANGTIRLKTGITRLNTVFVTAKPVNPGKVVRKAFAQINNNYNSKSFLQKFFYRHYCKDGDAYGRLVEASVDIYKGIGYRKPQKAVGLKDEIRITQLRRSLDNTRGAIGHEPISISDALEADLVGYQAAVPTEHLLFHDNVSHLRMDMDDYTFGYNGITIYDGQEVYEITYEYKRDSALTRSGDYILYTQVSGKLYVNTEDYAFVKTEQERTHDGSVIRQDVYYRKFGKRYYPYHFVLTGMNKAPAWGNHEFHIELMSVDIDTDKSAEFTGEMPGEAELLTIPYDSSFWANSTVLRTTPLEDQIIKDLGGGKSLNEQFEIYRQYQACVHNGGVDAVEKFNWLREYFKEKYALYLVFWSENFKSYIVELEMAKRVYPSYRDDAKFIFISLDDDNDRWKQTVNQFNFFSDGIINYRIGSSSKLLKEFHVKDLPSFVLIRKNGERVQVEAKRPNDPQIHDQLKALIDDEKGVHQ